MSTQKSVASIGPRRSIAKQEAYEEERGFASPFPVEASQFGPTGYSTPILGTDAQRWVVKTRFGSQKVKL